MVKADTVPLPTSVLGVDDIVEEFRGSLTTKIAALGKNYITKVTNQSVTYSSNEAYSCNGFLNQPGEPLAKIEYSNKTDNKQLIEKTTYTGCNNDVTLVEDVITRGENLSPLPMKKVLEGKRTIDLQDNETYRLYKLSNVEGDVLFQVLLEKTLKGKAINYYFLGQQILSMIYEYQATSTRLSITYFGYSIEYARKHAKWKYNYQFTPYLNVVLASTNKEDPIIYFDSNNNRLSLSGFITSFNEGIMKYTISTLAEIVQYHTMYFPKTATTQTGAQSQKFLEELRIAQNRLLNNIELNLVRNLLQDYVNAAEKGLIIDNRPKN